MICVPINGLHKFGVPIKMISLNISCCYQEEGRWKVANDGARRKGCRHRSPKRVGSRCTNLPQSMVLLPSRYESIKSMDPPGIAKENESLRATAAA